MMDLITLHGQLDIRPFTSNGMDESYVYRTLPFNLRCFLNNIRFFAIIWTILNGFTMLNECIDPKDLFYSSVDEFAGVHRRNQSTHLK